MVTSSLLVADADALQRQLFDMILSVDAFDVTMVGSGAEALAHLREHTPSAVILAIDLPDVPGTVICRKLKTVKRLSRVPVVLVAPEPEPGKTLTDALRRDVREAGADLLLQKPLGDKNLRERLQRLLAAPPPERPSKRSLTTSSPDGARVAGGGSQALTPSLGGVQPASELGGLRAEVARLRHENEALKARLVKVKELNKALQNELEEARKPRGLFGRRG
jgi:two-component system, OmpR family, response regulator